MCKTLQINGIYVQDLVYFNGIKAILVTQVKE